jgi:hypothetical protein
MTNTHTTSSQASGARTWAGSIARGYAAETTPPLTDALREDLEAALKGAGFDLPSSDPLDATAVERINRALDAFELDLGAVVGPRVDTISTQGILAFRQRSEAGRPLRAYGGQ